MIRESDKMKRFILSDSFFVSADRTYSADGKMTADGIDGQGDGQGRNMRSGSGV